MQEKKLILLVDDNDFYHTAAELILKNTYDVISVRSGKEAVEYLLDSSRTPDLILLDIVMPDMDGWLTFNRLRKIAGAENTPIAIISSVYGEAVENHARSVGAADFITKPYDKKDLLQRIGKIIN